MNNRNRIRKKRQDINLRDNTGRITNLKAERILLTRELAKRINKKHNDYEKNGNILNPEEIEILNKLKNSEYLIDISEMLVIDALCKKIGIDPELVSLECELVPPKVKSAVIKLLNEEKYDSAKIKNIYKQYVLLLRKWRNLYSRKSIYDIHTENMPNAIVFDTQEGEFRRPSSEEESELLLARKNIAQTLLKIEKALEIKTEDGFFGELPNDQKIQH